MKTMLSVVGLGGCLLAGAAAQAQGIGVSRWYPTDPLTTEDREIITGTAQQQIHGKPPTLLPPGPILRADAQELSYC